MPTAPPSQAAARHPLRRLARGLLYLVGAGLALGAAAVVGFTVYAVQALPPLQPWHTERLAQEFTSKRHAGLDFAGYLQLEARLFDETARAIAAWPRTGDALHFTRFDPGSPVNRLVEGAPYNRSQRLTPPQVRGGALLVHGLTDSPYAMKAMAESLQARGFEVTLLRLPGHGTLPSMMTTMTLADWRAAVRIAARDVAARTPAGQPYYIGGFSTGGALSLLHTLETLQDTALRRPDRVLLMAPAIELAPVIAVTEIIDLLSLLPIPVLQKARWQEIVAEYDPYKFNSFPINAARQVHHATQALRAALDDAEAGGRLARLPPVITWQSVVDSTVGSTGAVDTLYARLPGASHRLVMFDVNRHQMLASVQQPAARANVDRLRAGTPGHTVDIVANSDPQSLQVGVQRRTPEGGDSTRPTPLAWPPGLVSLGHVALPFPPDDPAYGYLPGSGRQGVPSIGSWLLRGESGALTIGLGALTRLRSNPFWALIDEDLGAMAAADQVAVRR